MIEFYKDVYPEAVKAEQKKNPVKKAVGAAVIFNKPKGKEVGNKEKELTPEEKFFSDTAYIEVLNLLEEKPDLDRVRNTMRKTGSEIIKEFKKGGVIVVDGPKLEIHRDKLGEVFNRKKAAKIRDLRNENPEIATWQISNILNVSPTFVKQQTKRLLEAGLLEEGKEVKDQPAGSGDEMKSVKVKKRRSFKEIHPKADEIDTQIKWLVDNVDDLKQDKIIELLGGESMRPRVMQRIYKLGKEGFLERSLRFKNKEKEIIVEKIIPEEENNSF